MDIETEDFSSEGEELSQSQSVYSPGSEEAISSPPSDPSASQVGSFQFGSSNPLLFLKMQQALLRHLTFSQ